MHTYFLAAVFLSAVTASPLPDFSSLGYVLPTSGQPNSAQNPFQDFFAQTSTNPDNYNLEQPQILAQSPGTNLESYKFAQLQALAQIPSTNSDSYDLVQPQILVASNEEGMHETVRGDAPGGNEPIPLPILGPTTNYLPSDLQFQKAQCDATSSVCCKRDTGEDSQPAVCDAKNTIEFSGSDQSSISDSTNAKFGRYCLTPKYFSDCNQMWSLVRGTTGYDCYTGCEQGPLDRGHPENSNEST